MDCINEDKWSAIVSRRYKYRGHREDRHRVNLSAAKQTRDTESIAVYETRAENRIFP